MSSDVPAPAPHPSLPWRRLGCLAFGALLWLQLGAGVLARELAFAQPDALRISIYSLPLAFLALGSMLRWRVLVLLLFPTSFAGVLALAPPPAQLALTDPLRFGLATATLLAYVVWSAGWTELPDRPLRPETTREPVRRGGREWRPFRGLFEPRAALLVALFLVMGGVIPFVPELTEAITRSYARRPNPESTEAGIVLCCLALFFFWCVLAYTLFVTPAAEIETRVKQLDHQLHGVVTQRHTASRKLAFLLTVVLSLGLMLALLALRYA